MADSPSPSTQPDRSGLRAWLGQRATALVMAVFTLLVLLRWALAPGELTYERWAGIFAAPWMKVLTGLAILSMAYHAWVGMRDVLIDYVRPLFIRQGCYVFTWIWLTWCILSAADVLWRL